MMPDTAATRVEPTAMREDERAIWRDFLASSQQGTFYHDPAFGDVYRRKIESAANLVFRLDGHVAAVLPAGVVAAADGARELRSPFSASFAGLATRPSLGLAEAMAIVDAAERWARDHGLHRVILQQPPVIYGDTPDETIEFVLRHRGFEQSHAELTYFLTPTTVPSSLVARNVRKAESSGCRLETVDLDEAWRFISTEKAGRDHPFGIELGDLQAIAAAFPDAVQAFGVSHGGALVAALLAYRLNSRVLLGFHWAQRAEAQHLRPTDYLIHEVARRAFDQGARAFDLGTTTIGGEPVWGVTRFKEKFHPAGAMRRRFVKHLI